MRKISLFFFIALLLPVTLIQALTVDVFTISALGVRQSVVLNPLPKTANVHIFKLDKLKQLQNGLNQFVKSSVSEGDNHALKKVTMQWVSSHENDYKKVASTAQGIYRDNITEIPAIIFNHKYSVLGTTDLNQAYQIYLNKVGQKHE